MCCEKHPAERLSPFRDKAKKYFFWIWLLLALTVCVLPIASIPRFVLEGQSPETW